MDCVYIFFGVFQHRLDQLMSANIEGSAALSHQELPHIMYDCVWWVRAPFNDGGTGLDAILTLKRRQQISMELPPNSSTPLLTGCINCSNGEENLVHLYSLLLFFFTKNYLALVGMY